MVRWSDVFDPGNRILDRFVNISYSWLNRNICTYDHWDNHFYILGSGRKDLLPIPQCTEDNSLNVNVMCCPRCVEKRIENHHFKFQNTGTRERGYLMRGKVFVFITVDKSRDRGNV
jgi:hypothetical protein